MAPKTIEIRLSPNKTICLVLLGVTLLATLVEQLAPVKRRISPMRVEESITTVTTEFYEGTNPLVEGKIAVTTESRSTETTSRFDPDINYYFGYIDPTELPIPGCYCPACMRVRKRRSLPLQKLAFGGAVFNKPIDPFVGFSPEILPLLLPKYLGLLN